MPSNDGKITLLLDKTTDFDKDERYMATSDLCHELNQNVELGPYLEPKVCAAVLKQLDDKSNDVQSIAVKCLGILVTKVQEAQVADICSKLCDLILNGKPELRDIYSIGLKTILADVSQSMGAAVSTSICSRLLTGLASKEKDQNVKAETLDILTDLLRRFGHDIATEHETIMEILMTLLTDASPLVRKRATACVGALGVMASDALVRRLVEHLIHSIEASSESVDVRTLIQTVGTLSRSAGHRLGQHLQAVIPILADFCGDPDNESLQNESSNELRENCFQAFESFVIRCHNEITPHVERILNLVMEFIKYDPNYNYGSSGDEDEPMDEDEEEYSDEDDGDYSDDDDTSWKVRRAALRVLTAIITTRPEMLEHLYATCSQQLISRFKEREENVRIDVFNVFAGLLRATKKSMLSASDPNHPPVMNTCIAQLDERVKLVVMGANKQFGPKASVSSRCAVIALLTELAMVKKGKLGDYISVLMPNLLRAAEDKHSDLKLDALVFLRLLIDTHSVEPFRNHVTPIVDVAVHCAKGDWYKTVSKALGLIESLVRIIRSENSDKSYNDQALLLFEAVLPHLKAHDIDQEIKEAAISSMGQLIAVLGDVLGDRIKETFPLLMERLSNEITRVPSMKAIGVIARSNLNLDISPILSDCTLSLAQLLRQQSRTLKQTVLDTLNALIVHYGNQIKKEQLCDVVSETSYLIVDSDLQLCRLGIVLVSNTLRVCPEIATSDALLQKAQIQALSLCRSSMLQGSTLEALKGLFAQLTQLDSPGSGFIDLFTALMKLPSDGSKHSVLNLARCVAAICVATSEANRQMAFEKFVGELTNGTSEKNKMLSLYCLGEFGRQLQLTGYTDVKATIVQCFAAPEEEVKAAAAYALGSICVGNMQDYLETIMQKLEHGESSYLLLSSLREVISDHAANAQHGFSLYVDRVVPVLTKLSENEEEGVRNMVAECLGKLAVTNAEKLIPVITELCASTSVGSRWTAVTSFKYALSTSAKGASVDHLFSQLDAFLKALNDEDLHVRRATLLTLNTAAHHHAHYLLPYVKDPIFPALLSSTELKLERVVDLGPFKHKVDDGLPLRKAAYSCVDTLIETLPQQLDIAAFYPHLERGLRDQDDIQMLNHQIIVKICHVKAGAMIGALDLVVEPLEKTVNKKVKTDQVGPEVERTKDLIRSALRAIDAINVACDTTAHPKFNALFETVKKNKTFAPILEAIKSERLSG